MNQPIASLFKNYVERRNLADSSIAIKSRAVRHFISLYGDMNIQEITYGHIEDYAAWLCKTKSASTANFYIANFKPFSKWLVSRGYLKNDFFSGIGKFALEKTEGLLFEPDEIERLLKISDNRWKVIIILALCGLRRAEIQNLVVKDVFFDKDYILLSSKKDTATTWRWTIKNHAQAIIALPKFIGLSDCTVNVHNTIIDLIDSNPAKQPYLVLPSNHYQKNIVAKNKGELTYYLRLCPYQNFNRHFQKLCKRALVAQKHFQDLRATFATNLLFNGMSLVEVQRAMRHSSPAITSKYYCRIKSKENAEKTRKILEKCYISKVP